MTTTELASVITAILLSNERASLSSSAGDASINTAVEDAFKIMERVGQNAKNPDRAVNRR